MAHRYLVRRAVAGGTLALAVVVLLVVARGCGGGSDAGAGRTERAAQATPSPTPTPAQLPGGGRHIFPGHRVVAFYGNPADDELGALGIGTPAQAARRLAAQAKAYDRPRRRVLPAMELIVSVANADPGEDGLYRRRETGHVIRRYLRAARRAGALLVLDIQPGRAAFMPEVKRLRRFLRQPDVGLALDPEWHVAAPEVPGQVIGSVQGSDVEAIADWLDALTGRLNLPQKLFLVHEFTDSMITDKQALRPHRNLATVLNADGFGTQPVKIAKYRAFTKLLPWTFDGFKLFYKEDVGLMSPRQVLHLHPSPDVVVYE